LPLSMRIGRGDGPAALENLRRQLWRTYGELTDMVLFAALRDFPHDNLGVKQLREAHAAASAPAPAA
jgi:hypothetical protein